MKKEFKNFKYNKKKNSMFAFKIMLNETAFLLNNDRKEEAKVYFELLKEYFSKGTLLMKEVKLYEVLLESYSLEEDLAKKVLNKIKETNNSLDKIKIKETLQEFHNKLNKLNKNIYNSFIPEYKQLGAIYQFLNEDEVDIKTSILIEEKLFNKITTPKESNLELKDLKNINEIKLEEKVEKFNNFYYNRLNDKQKSLLREYVKINSNESQEKFQEYIIKEMKDLNVFFTDTVKFAKDNESFSVEEITKLEEQTNVINEKISKIEDNINLDDNLLLENIMKIYSYSDTLKKTIFPNN